MEISFEPGEMEFEAAIALCGNSKAVNIPANIIRELGLERGDEVLVRLQCEVTRMDSEFYVWAGKLKATHKEFEKYTEKAIATALHIYQQPGYKTKDDELQKICDLLTSKKIKNPIKHLAFEQTGIRIDVKEKDIELLKKIKACDPKFSNMSLDQVASHTWKEQFKIITGLEIKEESGPNKGARNKK